MRKRTVWNGRLRKSWMDALKRVTRERLVEQQIERSYRDGHDSGRRLGTINERSRNTEVVGLGDGVVA